jgi:hypothetical protein
LGPQEISELDRQLNGLNSHLADLAGLRELEGSMAATKVAEEQAQAQHDSQAEQVRVRSFMHCGFAVQICEVVCVLATKAAEEQAQAQHDSQVELLLCCCRCML